MVIHQGDQYVIPIKIKVGDTVITPNNCTDVRIKVGFKVYSYLDESATYDAENERWLVPMKETTSFHIKGSTEIQVAVKFDQEHFYSATKTVDVEKSIIKEIWNGR